jgi:hypothetical protein
MFRQDMIRRAIEQLAAALARAAGLSRGEQHAEALEVLREAKGALLSSSLTELCCRPRREPSSGASSSQCGDGR